MVGKLLLQEDAIKYNASLKILRKDTTNPMNIMDPQNPRKKLSKYTLIYMCSHQIMSESSQI